MKLLITAGPTREPIDPVRFISNQSSGQMGVALATAGVESQHETTVIFGPVNVELPAGAERIDIVSSRDLYKAVLEQFPACDVLIMSAAVADYRPKVVSAEKIGRSGDMTIELEATEDIVAAAAAIKRPNQVVIGFSLEAEGNLERARTKLLRKNLDMIVYNPLQTMNSPFIQATLLYADGRSDALPPLPKLDFARLLVEKASLLRRAR